MLSWLGHVSSRQAVFAVFTMFIFGSSAVEIVTEFLDGETVEAMLDDITKLSLSMIVVIILVRDRFVQQRALRDLRSQLSRVRGQLSQLDNTSQQLASQYRSVMQKQFDAWKLTTSEQDVVIGMLKGLSFREIAELRETREKTVRQQASSVYRKAGVASRHELAAWFFEDMLDPPPVVEGATETNPA